jgi:hypothetical protein
VASVVAVAVLVLLVPLAVLGGLDGGLRSLGRDRQVGQSFQVPYRLTDTNHLLVRVRINGKGPFNFLVDSGAPALFIATETGRKIGLKAAGAGFWTLVDRLDLEGGAQLVRMKARLEDPFQLVGMNALGLPGASIDGILGFTVLARFRVEIDLMKDRMIWTRLDHEPGDPPAPRHKQGEASGTSIGVQVVNAIGPLAKGLAFLMGKQPEEQWEPRGFLGLEWSEKVEAGRKELLVQSVLDRSPAARGDIRGGDSIVRMNDRAILGSRDARAALAKVRPGDMVPLVIRRRSATQVEELTLTLTAGEGL